MAFAFSTEVKLVKAPQILNSSTEAEWNAMVVPLPENFMAYATDTRTLKIGDGVTLYSNLPVFYSAGMVDAVQHIHFVADITARNALTGSAKNGLIVVLDASGDPTVESSTKKQATYVWNNDTTSWEKLAEQESLDYDFSDFFKIATNTADDINDGATKCIMTKVERTNLADLVSDAFYKSTDTADNITEGSSHLFMTTTERSQLATLEANAMRYTDQLVIQGMNASEIAAVAAPASSGGEGGEGGGSGSGEEPGSGE